MGGVNAAFHEFNKLLFSNLRVQIVFESSLDIRFCSWVNLIEGRSSILLYLFI